VQVNGRVRDRIQVAADLDEATLRETAVQAPGAQRFLDGKAIRDIIIAPGRLVNIVTKS
jgi:leucyl-tRNA synthetase